MKKKAVELSLNVIIVAALALIVLIVLIAIFSGSIRRSTEPLGQTQNESAIASREATWCLSSLMSKCNYEVKSCSEIKEGASSATQLPSGVKDCKDGERRVLAGNAAVGKRLCCIKT